MGTRSGHEPSVHGTTALRKDLASRSPPATTTARLRGSTAGVRSGRHFVAKLAIPSSFLPCPATSRPPASSRPGLNRICAQHGTASLFLCPHSAPSLHLLAAVLGPAGSLCFLLLRKSCQIQGFRVLLALNRSLGWTSTLIPW
jgi:hypothetical protein